MERQRLSRPVSRAAQFQAAPVSRKEFIRYAGLSGIAATVLAGCTKAISNLNTGSNLNQVLNNPITTVSLGTGDLGVLNFAYALEQLEAAFYIQVAANPFENIDSLALSRLTDIRQHEIAHREFFKNLLGKNAIPALTTDFTSINFATRTGVLTAAKTFEDIGVAAYNNIACLFQSAEWVTIVGKIVSVEARHAAYVSDLIGTGDFADASVTTDGRERDMKPAQVLQLIQPYFKETLDISGLPTA
jgi:hypothetical protein